MYIPVKRFFLLFVAGVGLIILGGCSDGMEQTDSDFNRQSEGELVEQRALLEDMMRSSTSKMLKSLNLDVDSNVSAIITDQVNKLLPLSDRIFSGDISKEEACDKGGTVAISGRWDLYMRPGLRDITLGSCSVFFRGVFDYDECNLGNPKNLGEKIGGVLSGSVNTDMFIAFTCIGPTTSTWNELQDLIADPFEMRIWAMMKSDDGLISSEGTIDWLNYEVKCLMTDASCVYEFKDAKIGDNICAKNFVPGGIDCGPDILVNYYECPYICEDELGCDLKCELSKAGNASCVEKLDDSDAFCFGNPVQEHGCCVRFSESENTCDTQMRECAQIGGINGEMYPFTVLEIPSTVVCRDYFIQPMYCKQDSDCRNGAKCDISHQCSCAVNQLGGMLCDGTCEWEDHYSLCPQDCIEDNLDCNSACEEEDLKRCPFDCIGDGICQKQEHDEFAPIDCTCNFNGVCNAKFENTVRCSDDCP